MDWDGVGFAGSRIDAVGVGNCTLVFKTPSTEGDRSPDRLPPRETGEVSGHGGGERNQIVRMVDPLRMLTTRILPLG